MEKRAKQIVEFNNGKMINTSRPKISIVVAVYNTEKYLSKCIESILQQTCQNIELILVDDGSTDSSLKICEEYKKKDNRVLVKSKENGGQGSARNLGLQFVTGDWIGFVDSDDWIDHDMYEHLLSIANNENADIVECGWRKIDEKGTITFESKNKYYSITGKEALKSFVYAEGLINTSVCNKIFRKDIAISIRFPEVRAYEDDEWIHKAVWEASKITISNIAKYNYFIRSNSTMTSEFNLNKIALVTVQSNICDFVQANAPEYYNKAQKTLLSKQFYIIACLMNNAQIERNTFIQKQIESDIMKNYKSYIKNPLMFKNRVFLLLFKYLPCTARKILSHFC